jgi:hypothetical protein
MRVRIVTDATGHSPFADDDVVPGDIEIASSIWQQAGVTVVAESIEQWSADAYAELVGVENDQLKEEDWTPASCTSTCTTSKPPTLEPAGERLRGGSVGTPSPWRTRRRRWVPSARPRGGASPLPTSWATTSGSTTPTLLTRRPTRFMTTAARTLTSPTLATS